MGVRRQSGARDQRRGRRIQRMGLVAKACSRNVDVGKPAKARDLSLSLSAHTVTVTRAAHPTPSTAVLPSSV